MNQGSDTPQNLQFSDLVSEPRYEFISFVYHQNQYLYMYQNVQKNR